MPSTPTSPGASAPSHTAPSHSCTSAVAIKPPHFMAANPEAWFIILEAQFHLANVTVLSTQFYHALAALPPEVVGQLPTSTLTSPDYTALKAEVIALTEASKPEILDRFLRDRPLSGKPSHYLAEMSQLAAKAGLGDELVRHKFQQALPPTIGPIIASQKTTPLPDLGKLADELCSLTNNLVINRVPSDSSQQHSHTGRKEYHQHRSGLEHCPNSDLRPFSADQRPKICRAHIFFADRAKTCRTWCRWPNKSFCRVTSSNRTTPRSSPNSSRDNSPSRERLN